MADTIFAIMAMAIVILETEYYWYVLSCWEQDPLFFLSEGFFGVLERGKAASILEEGKSSSHRCCCFYDMEIDGEPSPRAAHHYTYAQYYPPFHIIVVLYQRWKCRLFKKPTKHFPITNTVIP